jgi:probable phosphoglycerate mutase
MTTIATEPAALPAVYLIRHGQTAWSLSGRHTGRTDLPLTPAGEQEARALACRLRPVVFGRVFCSPRLRDRQTCELAGLGNAVEIEPELVEWDYGDYEGLLTAEIQRQRPDWDIYRDGCPNGESPAEISGRADRLIARLRTLAGNTALFTHGHFSRILAVRWAGLTVPDAAHLISSTASVGILTYEHNLSQPGLALWNAV